MAVELCFRFTFCFLVLLLFLSSFSAEDVAQNGDNKTTEPKKPTQDDGIVPGERVLAPESKILNGAEGVNSSEGEKTLRIKQSENGKTTEDVKAPEDEPKSEEKAEDKVEKKEEQQQSEKEEDKVEEKEPEEAGIDLKVLDDDSFEHLTQASSGATTGDWLVSFTKKDGCEKCSEVEKIMRIVYARTKHKLNVAKVEEGSSSKLTFKRFNIKALPSIFLFHHGKMFTYGGDKNVDDITNFVTEGFNTMTWSKIKHPYSHFELFMEEATDELRHMIRFKKLVTVIIFLAGLLVGVSLTSICGSVIFHLLENFKDDDDEENQEPPGYEKVRDEVKNKSE